MKIKTTLLFAALILFLSGCRYAQLISVIPARSTIKTIDNTYTYENDTLAVKYYFWAEKGVMAFSVFNKLDIPIYIDWKKSSFIDKNMKYDYYHGRETKKAETVSIAYSYRSIFDWSRYFGSTIVGGSIGSEVSIKEERITFIPPKSYIIRSDFKIIPKVAYFNWQDAELKRIATSATDTTETFSAYVIKADESEPIFVFRNFLTYSTKESFDSEHYINDEFFIRTVITLKQNLFYKYYDSDARWMYITDIQSPY